MARLSFFVHNLAQVFPHLLDFPGDRPRKSTDYRCFVALFALIIRQIRAIIRNFARYVM